MQPRRAGMMPKQYRNRRLNQFTSVFCPFTKAFINSKSTTWRRLQNIGFGVHATPYYGRLICLSEPQRLVSFAKNSQRKHVNLLEQHSSDASHDVFADPKHPMCKWIPALRDSLGDLLLTMDCSEEPEDFISSVETILESENAEAAKTCLLKDVASTTTKLNPLYHIDVDVLSTELLAGSPMLEETRYQSNILLLCSQHHQAEFVKNMLHPVGTVANDSGKEAEEKQKKVLHIHLSAPTTKAMLESVLVIQAPKALPLFTNSFYDDVSHLVVSGAEFLAPDALDSLSSCMQQRAKEGAGVSPFGGVRVVILADLLQCGASLHRSPLISSLYRNFDDAYAPAVRAFHVQVKDATPTSVASALSVLRSTPSDNSCFRISRQSLSSPLADHHRTIIVPTLAQARSLELADLAQKLSVSSSSLSSPPMVQLYDACLQPITLVGEWTKSYFFRAVHQLNPRTGKPYPFARISLREVRLRTAAAVGVSDDNVDVFPLDYGAQGDTGLRVRLQATSDLTKEQVEERMEALLDVLEDEEERVELLRRDTKTIDSVWGQEPYCMCYPNQVEQALWATVTRRWPRLTLTIGSLVHFFTNATGTIMNGESIPNMFDDDNSEEELLFTRTGENLEIPRGMRAVVVGFDVATSPLERSTLENQFLNYQYANEDFAASCSRGGDTAPYETCLPIVELLYPLPESHAGNTGQKLHLLVEPVIDEVGGYRGVHHYVLRHAVLPIRTCRYISINDVNHEAHNNSNDEVTCSDTYRPTPLPRFRNHSLFALRDEARQFATTTTDGTTSSPFHFMEFHTSFHDTKLLRSQSGNVLMTALSILASKEDDMMRISENLGIEVKATEASQDTDETRIVRADEEEKTSSPTKALKYALHQATGTEIGNTGGGDDGSASFSELPTMDELVEVLQRAQSNSIVSAASLEEAFNERRVTGMDGRLCAEN